MGFFTSDTAYKRAAELSQQADRHEAAGQKAVAADLREMAEDCEVYARWIEGR